MTDPDQDPAPLGTGEGELAEALREARRFGPTDAQLASLAASLGPAPGPGGGGGPGPGGMPAIAKWAAAAVALVGIAGSLTWIGLGSSDDGGSPPSVEAAPIAVAAPSPPEPARAELARPPEPRADHAEAHVDAPSESSPTETERGGRRTAAPRPAVARGEPATEPPTILPPAAGTPEATEPEPPATEGSSADDSPSELALLEAARAALRSRPAEALARADRHRALYPRGAFAQERELLAIEALVRMHRRDDAQGRVERFRASWPASVHETRLSVLLSE